MIKVYKSFRGTSYTILRSKLDGGERVSLPPVRFDGGLLRTNDKTVQEFIESSADFGVGVKLVGVEDAQKPAAKAKGKPAKQTDVEDDAPDSNEEPADEDKPETVDGLVVHDAKNMTEAKLHLESLGVDVSGLRRKAETAAVGKEHGINFVNL